MHERLSALLLLAACHAAPPPGAESSMSPAPTWTVYDGADLVLSIRGSPGALTSTAPPPPGGVAPVHPFLSAAAHSASHEAELKAILDGSEDLPDFLRRLEAEGYRVQAD